MRQLRAGTGLRSHRLSRVDHALRVSFGSRASKGTVSPRAGPGTRLLIPNGVGWGGKCLLLPPPPGGAGRGVLALGTPHSPDWAGPPCHPLSRPPEPPSSPPASSATPRHYSQQCRQQPSTLHAHLSGLHHDPACEDRCHPVHTGTLSSEQRDLGSPQAQSLAVGSWAGHIPSLTLSDGGAVPGGALYKATMESSWHGASHPAVALTNVL